MDKKHFRLSNRFLVILLVVMLIILVPSIVAYVNSSDHPSINSPQDVANQCKSSSISKSTSCAVSLTSDFYKYNLTNVGKDLSFSELKNEGGVCSSWSDYYNEVGNDLGYNTNSVIIPIIGDGYHEFSVWSDETGYCVVDQIKDSCVSLNTKN